VVSPGDTRETGSLHGCAWRYLPEEHFGSRGHFGLLKLVKKTKAKKPPPACRTIVELKVPCAHMENFSEVFMKVSFKCDY
jgi:hypothetical protein